VGGVLRRVGVRVGAAAECPQEPSAVEGGHSALPEAADLGVGGVVAALPPLEAPTAQRSAQVCWRLDEACPLIGESCIGEGFDDALVSCNGQVVSAEPGRAIESPERPSVWIGEYVKEQPGATAHARVLPMQRAHPRRTSCGTSLTRRTSRSPTATLGRARSSPRTPISTTSPRPTSRHHRELPHTGPMAGRPGGPANAGESHCFPFDTGTDPTPTPTYAAAPAQHSGPVPCRLRAFLNPTRATVVPRQWNMRVIRLRQSGPSVTVNLRGTSAEGRRPTDITRQGRPEYVGVAAGRRGRT